MTDRFLKLQDLPPFAVGNTIQLVGAIYAGEGKVFYCWIPEHRDLISHPEDYILDLDAPAWDEFLRQGDLQEVEIRNGVAKAIVSKTQRQLDTALSWRVFRRDEYTCCYCGANQVPLTVDHLVLWEVGGPTIAPNLLSACKKCNKTRGNQEYAAWIRTNPYYLRVSQNLTSERRGRNEALIPTLEAIRREDRLRSRK